MLHNGTSGNNSTAIGRDESRADESRADDIEAMLYQLRDSVGTIDEETDRQREIITKVAELFAEQERTIENLEQQVEKMEPRAVATRKKMQHFTEDILGSDGYQNDPIIDRLERIERKQDELLEHVRDAVQYEAPSEMGKTELAELVAADEAVSAAEAAGNGKAGITAATVGSILRREFNIKSSNPTIYNAMEDAAEKWTALHIQEGKRGPGGRKKRLCCSLEKVDGVMRETLADAIPSKEHDSLDL